MAQYPLDFYPRSPCGERHKNECTSLAPKPFLSTLSLRRATISCAWSASKLGDFYPRSPCGERPPARILRPCGLFYFYPRSPCGERHRTVNDSDDDVQDFYPRSPCGERLAVHPQGRAWFAISIHALLAESDKRAEIHASSQQEFLSTLSLRRATVTVLGIQHRVGISIHALLAESDTADMRKRLIEFRFLSTLSLRRATAPNRRSYRCNKNFYPRSPCGERHRTRR